MARRMSIQFLFFLVIFVLAASLVHCDELEPESDGIVGFRVRISRWFLTPKRIFEHLQIRSSEGAADLFSAQPVAPQEDEKAPQDSGAATLLWAGGETQNVADEDNALTFVPVPDHRVGFIYRERDEKALPPAPPRKSEPRKILRGGIRIGAVREEPALDVWRGHGKHKERRNDWLDEAMHQEHGHDHEQNGEHGGKWRRRLTACRSDVDRFCRAMSGLLSVDSDSRKSKMPELLLCLSQNQAQLSPECSAELPSCASFQCAADAARLCSSVVGDVSTDSWHDKKHRMISCLESQPESLSGKCLNAINERRVRHGKSPLESGMIPKPPTWVNDPPLSIEAPPVSYIEEDEPNSYESNLPRPSYDRGHSLPVPSNSNTNAQPQWALIAVAAMSAAFVFMAALTVVLLVQHKRRRQREAVLQAANSLTLPAPPPADDVHSQHNNFTQFEVPYHRLDEAQLV